MNRTPEAISREDRLRVRECCRRLAPIVAEALVVQMERVFWQLRPTADVASLEPNDVVAAYRSKGLIPPSLLVALKERGQGPAAAVAFAACIYPTRSAALLEQLEGRLDCFLAAFGRRGGANAARWVEERLPEMDRSGLHELLNDLSAAQHVPSGADANLREQCAAERCSGAALYLLTYHAEDLQRIVGNWRDDAALVRYVRTFLPTCPSREAGQEAEKLDRDTCAKIRVRLHADAPGTPDELIDRTILLERHVRRRLRDRPPLPDSVAESIAETVADCWEVHWDRLNCGFPYYAFRSHFAWWWRQSVGWWLKRHVPVPEPAAASGDANLSAEQLLVYREGYRLVRTTFFGRDTANTPRLRRALDDLWRTRLENLLSGEADDSGSVKAVAYQHEAAGVTAAQINMLSYKLRLRIWAYNLSRCAGRSNEQLQNAKLPTHDGASDYPLADRSNRSGVLVVASLARVAPIEYSLIWAFTSHRFWRACVEPQHPDPWEFGEHAVEIWHWIKGGSWDLVIKAADEAWDPVSVLVARDAGAAAIRAFIEALARCATEETVRRWLAGEGAVAAARAEAAGRDLLAHLAEPPAAMDPAGVKAWRRAADTHWIVPVWHLAILEKLQDRRLLERLNVDKSDVPVVKSLSSVLHAAPVGAERVGDGRA